MTTFTYQLFSRKTSTPEVWQCECEYKEYSSHSATVSVAVLCMGYAEVVFTQPGGKLDTMWPDIKVRCGRYKMVTHCSRTVLPLTRPETQQEAKLSLR